ncbi:MAG TPA: hypothetical protein VGK50_08520 [Coriobacteriia bacterium]|jgi:hypothetical protein
MRRFRVLPVVLVLSVALSGCAAKVEAGKLAAAQEIAAGDKLAAAKDFDGALKRYVKAANECSASPLYDEALGKAANTLISKVEQQPLPLQVSACREFLGSLPEPVLPLRAHNWLSETLRADAEAAVSQAKAFSAENRRVLGTVTPAAKPAVKKTATKKTAVKPKAKAKSAKPVKPVVKPALPPTTTAVAATASIAATPVAAVVATSPSFQLPSAPELHSVADALPALGQPPAMQQLYESLAEIAAAMEQSAQARAGAGPGRPLTLPQRRTLTAADARLSRALRDVGKLLASL